MIRKILINIGVLAALLVAGDVSAQPSCRAAIPPVPADGYYAVDLSLDMLGHARRDLSDLRIIDQEGKEVAWLLCDDSERVFRGSFEPFATEVTSTPKETKVLIETDGKPLSAFTLCMKNADADKRATLRGSNDREKWFAVKERISLVNISNPERTEAYIPIEFPLSDYRYYLITIGDSLSAPLNITGVGVQTKQYSFVSPRMQEVPVKELNIRTEGKQTNVLLVLPYTIEVANLGFHISAPEYFSRDVKMDGVYQSYTLTSDKGRPLVVHYPNYSDSIRMVVYNKDDRPLQIDSIQVFAKKRYLVAGLKQGVGYRLTCGDAKARFPQYDLSFATQLPDSLAHLTLQQVELSPVIPGEAEAPWWIFLKTYGIWIIIVLISLQILYSIRKMLKQNPKQS